MFHVLVASGFGGLSSAASFRALSLAILSLFKAVLLGAFLTAAFGAAFGFGFRLAADFLALGFAPTFALPAGVLGPGFLVVAPAALAVLLAGARPV